MYAVSEGATLGSGGTTTASNTTHAGGSTVESNSAFAPASVTPASGSALSAAAQSPAEYAPAAHFTVGAYRVDDYPLIDSTNTECKRRLKAALEAGKTGAALASGAASTGRTTTASDTALGGAGTTVASNTALAGGAQSGTPIPCVNSLHNTVVLANQQTAGRGRLGRSFYSPPDAGIYISIILDTARTGAPLQLITPVAAVAVARTLEKAFPALLEKPLIKWVNDIYLGGKKACGILTEGVPDPATGAIRYAVLGIGINITLSDAGFPADIQDIATTVTNGHGFDRRAVVETLLNELTTALEPAATETVMAEYKSRSLVLGKQVDVVSPQGTYPARVVDVLPNGHLLIERAAGCSVPQTSGIGTPQTASGGQTERVELFTGEVSIRLPSSQAQ